MLRLEGLSDWIQARLIGHVLPAVAGMRLVIVQGGDVGSVLVRALVVDAIDETALYATLRDVLIALWVATLLVLRPTRARLLAAGLIAATLAGALTPRPLLSDTIRDAVSEARFLAEPVRVAFARLTTDPAAELEQLPGTGVVAAQGTASHVA